MEICNFNKTVYDYKSTNSKIDLISLIRNKKDYKVKDLNKKTKAQLFCIWCNVSN